MTVKLQTGNDDIETCDVRMTSISNDSVKEFNKVEWQDVFFYRFGYFSYQKMNLIDMVKKFYSQIWYKVDLIIDWEN